MFDYRYHALSLAAVLLALALGVVIGVAIGDSDLVSSAKSGIVHDLSTELGDAHTQASQLSAQLAGEEAFTSDLYPIAVHGLLSGRKIGLVFLGGSSNRVNGLVRNAVTQAGGNLVTVVAVREPLDLGGLAGEAAGTHYAALAPTGTAGSTGATGATGGGPATEVDARLVEQFGVLVGKQLVSGGQLVSRELLSRVRNRLLSAFDGQLGKLDGLVVMRDDPTGMSTEESKATSAFQSGLIDGVQAVGAQTVGVELTSTEPSQVPWYQSQDISSVDNLETTAGQAALIYALAGSHGAYGTKASADSLLPNVGGTSTQP
jgi:Copper transport outer membrane protein, MctB